MCSSPQRTDDSSDMQTENSHPSLSGLDKGRHRKFERKHHRGLHLRDANHKTPDSDSRSIWKEIRHDTNPKNHHHHVFIVISNEF